MSDRPDISPETAVLAAEYVLGVLSAEERAAFEARLDREPELLAEMRAWQAHFAALAEQEVEAVAPPPRVFDAIEAQVFGADAPRAAPRAAPRSAPRAAPRAATRPASVPLWDRIAFWRGLSLASGAVAAAAVAVAVLPVTQPPVPGTVPGEVEPGPIPPGRLLMTHLIPTEGSDLGLAVTREPSGVLQLRRVAGDVEAGRAREVWLILGDAAPVSLGLLGEDPLTTLTPDPEISARFASGAVLAISDEPPGGSPTGSPTGEILALGTLIPL